MNKLSLILFSILFLGALAGSLRRPAYVNEEEFNGELNENAELLILGETNEETNAFFALGETGELNENAELVALGETNEEARANEETNAFFALGETGELNENAELLILGETNEETNAFFALGETGELNENAELIILSETNEEASTAEEANAFFALGETTEEGFNGEVNENGELTNAAVATEEELRLRSDSSDSDENNDYLANILRQEQNLLELVNFLKEPAQVVERPRAQIPVFKLEGNKIVVNKNAKLNTIAF
jgi:hypothetical protein